MLSRILKLTLLAQCLLVSVAHAEDLTADDIARKMVRGDAFSWDGARAQVRMVLTGKDGKRQERKMDILGRRDKGLFRTMVRFVSPSSVAGTAFLMLERNGEPAEQYVYLSGLKRTRRIVGREQESSFMGSDFSYADLQGVAENYTTNKRLPDEKIGSAETYVISTELSPKAPAKYSKIVAWVRKSDLVALRTRFYDRSGKLLKTLYARKVKQLEGKPVVVEARMENQQSGHATEFFVDGIERKDDIPDVAFTPSALEHY